jgi:hypothetical protein
MYKRVPIFHFLKGLARIVQDLLIVGIRAKAVAIPGGTRSAFRDDSDHRSGLKAITDSDGKPITDWPIPDS